MCLTLDEHLNWKGHIGKKANKISRSVRILNKLKHVLLFSAKLHISLILSHINFCILGGGYKCDRIVKLQKTISRILSLSKHNACTKPIFKRLKLLKVSDILIMQELKKIIINSYIKN